MHFCPNCGYKITEQSNFCPQCGHNLKPETVIPASSVETIPLHPRPQQQHKINHTFTLLNPGDVFNQEYVIECIIGKDNDGISYQATHEKTGNKCSLKLYFQSYFDNVDKLFGSIGRMSKIKSVKHPNIAAVYEVNQAHKPAYIASEYIDGLTLRETRDQNPEIFTEEYVRIIAHKLVSAAIAVRKAGLAIQSLDLHNIVRKTDGEIVILTTGINYDVRDEREDILYLGIVLAKLAAKYAFYETIYTPLRVATKKFEFVSGISYGFNEILAGCLHRNISQRYANFEDMDQALKKLKTLEKDEIYVSNDDSVASFKDKEDIALPKKKLDIYFWGILIFIIVFICIMMTTNLLDAVFGNKKAPLKFTGFMTGLTDSTNELTSIASDDYREIKTPLKTYRRISPGIIDNQSNPDRGYVNPNVSIPAAQSAFTSTSEDKDDNPATYQAPAQKKQPIPDNFVYIFGDTYSFGSLRSNSRENASINGFYLSKTEVTQTEWNKYMRAATCSNIGENNPVDNITWFDAIVYCNTRSEAEGLTPCYKILGFGTSRIVSCNFKSNGYRLPTEVEWEYAARGKKLYSYSGSDNPDQVAWYKDNALSHIHLVKTKAANPFGLYDMTGNVAEWCWDWYDSGYPKSMPFINPTGPELGNLKVIRGGSIDSGSGSTLEVIYRNKGVPYKSYKHVGFRVVRGK